MSKKKEKSLKIDSFLHKFLLVEKENAGFDGVIYKCAYSSLIFNSIMDLWNLKQLLAFLELTILYKSVTKRS
jgi:hypothetical protein